MLLEFISKYARMAFNQPPRNKEIANGLKQLKSITEFMDLRSSLRLKSPKVLTYKTGDPLIIIKSLIDKTDIENIGVLCGGVKELFPEQFQDRLFDTCPVKYYGDELLIEDSETLVNGGGNSVIFIEGFMQKFMPQFTDYLMSSLCAAAEEVGWHPYPRLLGIRCIESLMYYPGGELRMHTDSESIFTIVIMLSRPERCFTGGDFVIKKKDDSVIKVSPNAGDAIIFDSYSLHGVDAIISGKRNVLVLELWAYQDTIMFGKRPPQSHSKVKVPVLMMSPERIYRKES
mmetsp:Transcript_20774/g.29620  ORF Transcript_20774/g.29620 Transcript_20774/m.29620 type:complete len:287 (+) Transcript_20774:469-1329(+)